MGSERLTLTVQETARILGISRNTAFSLARAGVLPGLLPRLGRRYLVGRQLLDEYLSGRWPTPQVR